MNYSLWCICRNSPTDCRLSFPVVNGNAWRWLAPSRSSPRVLLLDEPFGALDANVRKELRAWLRRLHDEVHVTTVFVTHDQEEALDVADRIVVINQGRIEQVGPPDELYDHPTSEFVMSFLGPVTTLDGHLVRPHDLVIETHPFDNGVSRPDRALQSGRLRGAPGCPACSGR